MLIYMYLAVQDLAEQAGDTEKVGELTRKLEELEERAEELDKQRSKGLSAIRSVPLHVPTYYQYDTYHSIPGKHPLPDVPNFKGPV